MLTLFEVSRIEKALQQEGFKEKIFTDEEIAYCESKKCHAAESFSGRYAVKEAVGKALGTGILPGQFEKIETLPDATGGASGPSFGAGPHYGHEPSRQ